jgi:tetratricopeptide (TPR) repeat protein
VRAIALLAGLVSLSMPSFAAAPSPLNDRSLGADPYDRCLKLVDKSPGTAFDQAEGWYQNGGGPAALHCEGLALVQLKRYAEAAGKFEEAARSGAIGSRDERAALLDQAGNAWLLSGKPDRADEDFSGSLGFAPHDEDTLADRGRARGLSKNWAGADADLTAVLAIDPNRADVLVLRASARHAEGRKPEARADIDHALEIYPDYPEALLERGAMKAEGGDADGARADWQEVLSVAAGTGAADEAKVRIQALGNGKR